MDSEFGLVFYSYLSIGTLNLKFASGGPAGGFATLFADLCSFVAKDGSRVRGFATLFADLCSFVAKDGSQY